MIKYKVTKCDDEYKIEVKGHANQNPYGSDIVCASVSTALIMTYNLLERLNLFVATSQHLFVKKDYLA